MNKFSDFGIPVERKGFTGDKIKIDRVLNREIKVLDYKVEDSKYKGKCLTLQIEINGIKHVVFIGSNNLIGMIAKVDKKQFPFVTTIEKEDNTLKFT